MPAKVDKIVGALLREGHSENSAYALANYIYDKQKSRRKRRNKKKKGKK